MKKLFLISLIFGLSCQMSFAQDDLYFSPKKKSNAKVAGPKANDAADTYYSGSNRDVDEYNRRNLYSHYELVANDSLETDIIDFKTGNGEYVDTTALADYNSYFADEYDEDDFQYSRRMGRFYDYYGWYDPIFFGPYHYPYWRHSYYSWYDPWYYRWYDPWYYTYYGYGYYGWNWHYYRNWYGWYDPFYPGYYGSGWITYSGHTGTVNHDGVGRSFGNSRGNSIASNSRGSFTGRRGATAGSRSANGSRQLGNVRQSSRSNNTHFNGSRRNSDFDAVNSGPRSFGSYNSNSSSSGSMRSGGGFSGGHSGGSRSGGGGHFGGRR